MFFMYVCVFERVVGMVLVSGWAGCAFDIRDMCNCMVEEEHEILTFYKGWMLLLPYFQWKGSWKGS